jgi:hypothetical protein
MFRHAGSWWSMTMCTRRAAEPSQTEEGVTLTNMRNAGTMPTIEHLIRAAVPNRTVPLH